MRYAIICLLLFIDCASITLLSDEIDVLKYRIPKYSIILSRHNIAFKDSLKWIEVKYIYIFKSKKIVPTR